MKATHREVPAAQQERHVLLRTEAFFGQHPPVFVFFLALFFTAVLGIFDYLTGPRFVLGLFYLMPIGLVTWHLGRRNGAAMVVLATATAFVADLLGGPDGGVIAYWNAVIRLGMFLVVSSLLSTLKDAITVQRDVADHEHEVSEKLRDLNELKNTLLHAVSHDLKGPLAAILGTVSTLNRAEQLRLTDAQRDSLFEAIDMSARKMDRLVNDLLDLDRIDRGLLHPERQPTDIGALANRVARECEALAAHPVRVDADRILVDLDPTMVERVIENLLVNAARHTPLATPVRVFVKERGAGIDLVVEDEGPGIPDHLKDTMFESFRQGPGSNGGGVGIGLSLVQRFAKLHGGVARVEDRIGGGARFVIELPGRVQSRDAMEAGIADLRAV